MRKIVTNFVHEFGKICCTFFSLLENLQRKMTKQVTRMDIHLSYIFFFFNFASVVQSTLDYVWHPLTSTFIQIDTL